jgi:hypothetical protein
MLSEMLDDLAEGPGQAAHAREHLFREPVFVQTI